MSANFVEKNKNKKAGPKAGRQESEELIEKVIAINRNAKVVKGGRRFSFSAFVAVGNGNGTMGCGFGKANEVSEAIRKALTDARKNFFKIPLYKTTIPHETIARFKAAKVVLRPAAPGTGIIAGGPVRAVCETCGIKDILTKSLRSNNPINVAKATFNALQSMRARPTPSVVGKKEEKKDVETESA